MSMSETGMNLENAGLDEETLARLERMQRTVRNHLAPSHQKKPRKERQQRYTNRKRDWRYNPADRD